MEPSRSVPEPGSEAPSSATQASMDRLAVLLPDLDIERGLATLRGSQRIYVTEVFVT